MVDTDSYNMNYTEYYAKYRDNIVSTTPDLIASHKENLARQYNKHVSTKELVNAFHAPAKQGNSEYQYYLARIYFSGVGGIPKNLNEASKWYRRAAQNKHRQAQYDLGLAYIFGWFDEPPSIDRAIKVFEESAKRKSSENNWKGNIDAQFTLATLYRDGIGVDKDWKKALYWFEQSASHEFSELNDDLDKNGLITAQYNLAESYWTGKFTPIDYSKSLMWFKKIADANDFAGFLHIGVSYLEGLEGVQDNLKAIENFEKSLDLALDAGKPLPIESFLFLINTLWETDDPRFNNYIEVLIKFASSDVAFAQLILSAAYAKGRGVPVDFEESNRWLTVFLQGHHKIDDSLSMKSYSGLGQYDSLKSFYQKLMKNILRNTLTDIEKANKNLKAALNSKEKLLRNFTHMLGNTLFPDVVYRIAEKLKQNPEFKQDALTLYDAYHAEVSIHHQSDLLRVRYTTTDSNKFIELVQTGCLRADSTESGKTVLEVVNYALERMTARFLNERYAKLKDARQAILANHTLDLESLRYDFEEHVILDENSATENLAIEWVQQNLMPISLTDASETWKKIRFKSNEHTEALFYSYFNELFLNAFKYADYAQGLSIRFFDKEIDGKTYLCSEWENKPRENILSGSQIGLESLREDLMQLNDAESADKTVDIESTLGAFKVTLAFVRGLLFYDPAEEDDAEIEKRFRRQQQEKELRKAA
jgi:TPR repeat protein